MTSGPVRYRFAEFVLSPRHRALTRAGAAVPLIPRYFDLLQLLVERRHEAVHRDDIFARVWTDVVVSDGALSQAVRTLRRTLGDDPREPRYIRTVSRHGYQFVCAGVTTEPDEGPLPDRDAGAAPTAGVAANGPPSAPEPVDALVERLTAAGNGEAGEADRRDAAEQLLALGGAAALERLRGRAGEAEARALLRDARWDVAGAADVPLLGQGDHGHALRALVALRARRAWALASRRWTSAAFGGAIAGCVAGVVGGIVLVLAPGSRAPASSMAVLGAIGAAAGALGAAGIGAGLAAAEALARSQRGAALVAGGALGGGLVGLLAQLVLSAVLEGLFGLRIAVLSGPLEGLVLGAAAGLGYASRTRVPGGGMAAPLGVERVKAAAAVALCCFAAALALAAAGRPLVGGLVNEIAEASRGAQIALTPLGRLIGEPGFGPVTRALIGALEGACLGLGLSLGLTRRPRVGGSALMR